MLHTGHKHSRKVWHRCRRAALAAVCALLPVFLYAGANDLVGSPAPDFALKSVDGPNLRLSEYRSEVVALNFWSDWCGKCGDAVAALDAISQEQSAAGLHVLTVDVNGKHGAHLVEETGLSYPVLLDLKSRVSKTYDLNRLPVTVLIDREGTVRFVQQGFKGNADQQLRAEILALLEE